MGTALEASDIRSELEGGISSGWGGDFVQEAASENPLPGILLKAQGGKENQDVGLGQGTNYSWKWIWVGWDGGKCFGTSHLEFVILFFLSPFISSVVSCLGGVFHFGGVCFDFVSLIFLVFCLSVNLSKAENCSQYPVKHAVSWMVCKNSPLNAIYRATSEREMYFLNKFKILIPLCCYYGEHFLLFQVWFYKF